MQLCPTGDVFLCVCMFNLSVQTLHVFVRLHVYFKGSLRRFWENCIVSVKSLMRESRLIYTSILLSGLTKMAVFFQSCTLYQSELGPTGLCGSQCVIGQNSVGVSLCRAARRDKLGRWNQCSRLLFFSIQFKICIHLIKKNNYIQ